jgi:hypothetical protein
MLQGEVHTYAVVPSESVGTNLKAGISLCGQIADLSFNEATFAYNTTCNKWHWTAGWD